MPDAVSARWSVRLNDHLRQHATLSGKALTHGGQCYADPLDNLIGSAVDVFEHQVGPEGLAHAWFSNVRSSQAFALNLFAGLDAGGRLAVARAAGLYDSIEVDPPVFEYTDPLDRLSESTNKSPHTTQVDVLYRCRDDAGEIHLLLIEVKLSEPDFSGCSAWQSADNDRTDLCGRPHPFGGDPAGCFQLRNHGHGERRRYDIALGVLSEKPSGVGCWFRTSGNQPMRLLALARALVSDGEAASAKVALCAPIAHGSIWRRWGEVTGHLAAKSPVGFAELTAESVLVHLPEDLAEHLADRYLLDVGPARRHHEEAAWRELIGQRFPHGARFRVTSPTGEVTFWAPCNLPIFVDRQDALLVIIGWPGVYETKSWAAPLDRVALAGEGWHRRGDRWELTVQSQPDLIELVHDPAARGAPWSWANGDWHLED